MFKKLLLFLFLLLSFAFTQGVDNTADVWDDLNPAVSDADSVYFTTGDTIHVANVETLWVFIPTESTQGRMWIHGTVTGSQAKAAEIVFEMAAHTGDGTALNTAEAESYQTMATTTATAGNTTAFSFWPMANATLKASSANYYTLRMRGTATGELSGIQIKIEYQYDKPRRGYF